MIVARFTQQPGFGLELTQINKRYYVYFTNQQGKAAQIKIGRYIDVSFDSAKRRAEELRSQIFLGGDPGADNAEGKAIPTYAELAKQHLADAELHQRSYGTTEMYMRRHILPKQGKTQVSEINGRDVA